MSQYLGQVPSFSIMDVLRGMSRRKLLILTCLALGVATGLAIVTLVKPKYQAEAKILLDNLASPYDSPNVTQQSNREFSIDERMVQSQVEVLQSADLTSRVVESMGLDTRPDFDSLSKGIGPLKQILIQLGFTDDPRLLTKKLRALVEVQDGLTVYPIPDSNIIGIKFSFTDGQTAADVANAVAQTYVLSTRETGSNTNSRAREWLSQQIETLRGKVAASDAAVEKFRSEAGLLKGDRSTLGVQEISELNTQITLAEAARSEAVAKAEEIRKLLETTGSVDASPEVLSSPTIQRLRELQVTASRRVSELSATYLPNHPKMIAAEKDVRDIEKQIRREALKIVEGLQGQAKIAAARAESLKKSLEQMKTRESVSLQDDVKLKELEREAKANRDQLELMLARYADSNTRQNLDLQPGFARIVQNAIVPTTPYFPRVGPVVLLASLAGLGLGLGLTFLLEIMAQAARLNAQAAAEAGLITRETISTAVRTAAQLQQPLPPLAPAPESDDGTPPPLRAVEPAIRPVPPAQPVMPITPPSQTRAAPQQPAIPLAVGTVPMARSAAEARDLLVSLQVPDGSGSAIHQLIEQLKGLHTKGKVKTCAIVGVGGGLEVAASSLAAARALAQSGVKTILVDLEPHRALIDDLMNLPYAPGISELVSGHSDFTKSIQRDPETPLQFIRNGMHNPISEKLLSERMVSVTSTLAGIYDVVLIHMGEASARTLPLIGGCRTALLFAPEHRMRDAAAAASTLRNNGVEQVFAVRVAAPVKAVA